MDSFTYNIGIYAYKFKYNPTYGLKIRLLNKNTFEVYKYKSNSDFHTINHVNHGTSAKTIYNIIKDLLCNSYNNSNKIEFYHIGYSGNYYQINESIFVTLCKQSQFNVWDEKYELILKPASETDNKILNEKVKYLTEDLNALQNKFQKFIETVNKLDNKYFKIMEEFEDQLINIKEK